MSVMIEVSGGSTFVVDLFVKTCPLTCLNFLKLCKIKYYNNNLIHTLTRGFMLQTGDPTGTGKGGNTIHGIIQSNFQKKHCVVPLVDEIRPDVEMNKKGLLCMANEGGKDSNKSQWFVTLRGNDLEYLNGRHTVFGEVVEGMDALESLADTVFVDEKSRPFQDIRILHTFILHDPYPDPQGLEVPDESPVDLKPTEETVTARIPFGEDIDKDKKGKTEEELEKDLRKEQARSNAEVLEIMGDLPSADIKPPENVLFVCQLNAITQDEDLELIFSRFGEIKECEIVRDKATGESLNYAFIEFRTEQQCQDAYFKMNNVVIDDRRIKVDFSQSVAKIWNKYSMTARNTTRAQPVGTKEPARSKEPVRDSGRHKEHRGGGDRRDYRDKRRRSRSPRRRERSYERRRSRSRDRRRRR